MKKENLEKLINGGFKVPPIIKKYEIISDTLYAVRSNDSSEDSFYKSNAGKFLTKLFVKGSNVSEAIVEVLKTSDNCFIQEMIVPDFSCVAFKTGSLITLVLNNGLCEGITAGKITGVIIKTNSTISPDYSRKGKQSKSLIEKGGKLILVEDSVEKFNHVDILTIIANVEAASRLLKEDSLNFEICYRDNELYFLQCRPNIG